MPIYMQYEGIKGSVTGTHPGWIELESAQLNPYHRASSSTGPGSSRDASVPSISEIVVTKHTDIASTGLFRESLTGQGKKVTIDFVKTDNSCYMKIELESVMISSYSVSGHGGVADARPMESLSLNFTKITYSTCAAPKTDAKPAQSRALWDLAAGKGS